MSVLSVDGDRLRELFDKATDLPPEQQEAFLARECGDHPRLREELAQLLSGHQAVEQQGQFRPLADRDRPPDRGGPLPQLVGYALLEELGRGGMGIVYKARQLSVAGRLVALKVVKAGPRANADDLGRFRSEIEAIARLQHPNIVQIYEVGEHAGVPFFSLEFCPQGSLDRRLARVPLPHPEAAGLVLPLARAVQHAHERGVLHRDLKPANVLLTEAADRPPGELVPKIADFGLAKKLDEPGRTTSRAILGTPQYMAPEQARAESKQVGPATDVYALGAILYECLTGRPPFTAATVLDTLYQVLHDDPVPVRVLQPRVPRDLETICSKCLRKEPAKRYASAAALAEDLRRFLENRPILARPVSVAEQCLKWACRRPDVAGLIATVLLVSVIGATVSTLGWRATAQHAAALVLAGEDKARAREGETRAQEDAGRNRYFHDVAKAHADWARAAVVRATELLDHCPPKHRGPEWHYVRGLCDGTPATLYGHASGVQSVCLSQDGTRLVSGGGDPQNPRKPGEVKLWDPRTGQLLFDLRGHTAWVSSVCLSPDGKRLASASWDQSVKLWDVQTGEELLSLRHANWVNAVCFSPDGNRLAVATGDPFDPNCRGWVQVGDLRTGAETLRLRLRGCATAVTFSPDGMRLAVGTGNPFIPEEGGEVQVWDTVIRERALTLRTLGGPAALAFRPDGKQLVAAMLAQTALVWDAETGQQLLTLSGHTSAVLSVCFSPDGTFLATSSRDQTVKVWDGRTGLEANCFKGHLGPVASVAFDATGARLISGSWDKTVRLWDARDRQEAQTLQGHPDGATAVCFSPDGQRFATGGEDGTVRIREAASGREVATFKDHNQRIGSLCYSPDGAWLAGAAKATVHVWDVQARTVRFTLRDTPGPPDSNWLAPAGDAATAFSPDGRHLAIAGANRIVRICDASSGHEVATLPGHAKEISSLGYSPDGAWLASGSADRTVNVWDTRSWERTHTLTGHTNAVTAVAFSPDSSLLVSGSEDKLGKLWDVRTGREVVSFKGHLEAVTAVVFSPDGSRVASASRDRTVRLWELRTGQEALSLREHKGLVNSLAFSPDGSRLVSAGGVAIFPANSGEVKVWTFRTPPGSATLAGQTGAVTAIASSPDGRRVACGSDDCSVCMWDVNALHSPRRFQGHTGPVLAVGFSPDGARVASAGDDGSVRVWDCEAGRLLFSFTGHSAPVAAVCFSLDGLRLASAGIDGALNVWELQNGTRTLHVSGTANSAWPDGFVPGGVSPAALASTWEPRAKIIDAIGATGARPAILERFYWLRHPSDFQEVLSWHRYAHWVSSLSFSADGKQIGILHDDTWKAWDATSGRELGETLQPPRKDRVLAIAYPSRPLLVGSQHSDTLRTELARLWADRPTWHEGRLGEAETARDLFAANFHLTRLLGSSPRDVKLVYRRGNLMAEAGRWKEAIADFTWVVERDPDWRALASLAWARLGAGHKAEFHVTVQDMAARARKHDPKSPMWAELARLVLVLPEDHRPLEMVPLGGTKPPWWDALALLRTGRAQEAAFALRQMARLGTQDEPLSHPDDIRLELLAALADLGCAERARARGAYETAVAALDARHPRDPNRSNLAVLPWDSRLELGVLRSTLKERLALNRQNSVP